MKYYHAHSLANHKIPPTKKPTKELHAPWMRLGLVSALLISLLLVIFTMAGIWYYTDLTRDLPSAHILPSLLEPPNGTLLQPTRLYDRTHEHVILTLENPAAVETVSICGKE